MKKLMVLFLALIMIFTLAACGEKSSRGSPTQGSAPTDASNKPSGETEKGNVGLSINDIVGTYEAILTNDKGDTQKGFSTFSKNESGQLIEDGNVYNYDQTTGSATFTLSNSSFTSTTTLVFTSKNAAVHVTGKTVVEGEHGTTTIYMDGYKTD
ncbi:MAG: lipoprotein [Syntrophomonadaceae bacterium]